MKSIYDSQVYCRHCNRMVALKNNGRCTNTGCGKSLTAPVKLNAKVGRKMARAAI